MSSYEELAGAERAVRDLLAGGREAELRSIPGVTHVSVGLKQTGGRALTDTTAIRVYVREKRPEDALRPAERIPRTIDGIPTDVNVVRDFDFSFDAHRARPLRGGCSISNRIVGLNAAGTHTTMGVGTLGFLATYNADHSPVLLSNWHVVMRNGARVGEPIFQPAPTSIPDMDPADIPYRPPDKTDAIAYITTSAITSKVDGAIARLDVSSWCRCFGLDFRNEIDGISIGGHPPSNAVVGQRPATAGMKVYKVGISTGRTSGHVVDPSYPPFTITRDGTTYSFDGQIEIAGDDTTTNFSEEGDSGSLIVDQDGYAVGLLFGSTADPPPAGETIANHIADVCSALNITLNLTTGSHHTAGVQLSLTPPTGSDPYANVRERLLREPEGTLLYALAEQHRHEIAHLITSERRVTVAWHRAGGPAFTAALGSALRDGRSDLPGEPAELVATIAPVLEAHGSDALRAALREHAPPLVDALRGAESIDDVVRNLKTPVAG